MPTNFSKEQKDMLDRNIIAIVSIMSPTGFPYMTPIWFVEYEGKIYFSTETTRTKGKFIAKNNNIGINITHPNGGPYVSIIGKAIIRRKNEFQDYKKILSLIFDRYVKPSEKEAGLENNLKNENRILVEIDPIKIIYPPVVW